MPDTTNIRKLYTAGIGSDGKHCVYGSGNGFGYDAGTLWPSCRLSSEADANAAARLCNEAYREGYNRAQYEIQKALGLVK